MTYAILGHRLTGYCIGRSHSLDQHGRRLYRIVCGGLVYEVPEYLLREVT
jgi:hypothetical protein